MLCRQHRRRAVGRLEHRLALLADREAADRVAVEVELRDLLDRPLPKLGVDPALADPEAQLALGSRRVALARRPLGRTPDGFLELTASDPDSRHLVEAHRDVAAQVGLDARGELGREPGLAAVVDAPERDAVVVDTRDRVSKREDLEAAGVGQDRAVPRHERMEPAEVADQLVAGPEMQVVRVTEQNLGAEAAHLERVERLDGSFRPDGHEDGSPHVPVPRSQHTGPRRPVGRSHRERHRISIASPNE